MRLVGNIGNSPLSELKLKKKQFLLLRHHLTKYLIINILKQIMQQFLNLSVDHLRDIKLLINMHSKNKINL